MPSPSPLQYGTYYHIFNRGTNGENVFVEKRNYSFFMQRYAKYIEPVAATYAYCLLKNHFHFLVRIKMPEEQRETLKVSETFRVSKGVVEPSRQFGHLLNAYAKAFNKLYGRTGSLFEHPFHRVAVETDAHFQSLVAYIHRNPQKHGFVDDFRAWPYSSYHALESQRPTRLQREAVLEWFGGQESFLAFHASDVREDTIRSIMLEDPKGLGDL
jgi:putative transposase